jgi:hypothetical protein
MNKTRRIGNLLTPNVDFMNHILHASSDLLCSSKVSYSYCSLVPFNPGTGAPACNAAPGRVTR